MFHDGITNEPIMLHDGIDNLIREYETICNKVIKEFRFWCVILNKESTIYAHDCDNNYDVDLDATQQEVSIQLGNWMMMVF